MDYLKAIKTSIANGLPNREIVRKVFLSYPTSVFKDNPELEFEILNSISGFFKINFTSIQIVGSCKLGYSYFKQKDFVKGESDLDIAIIDKELFLKYSDIILSVTNAYKDLTSFPVDETGMSKYQSFSRYHLKGIFRPDLMPNCSQKKEWFKFFNSLSSKHYEYFADINAGIYLSQKAFEYKQAEIIQEIKKY